MSKSIPELTIKATQPEQVEAYLKKLKHPMKKVAEALREVILDTDKSGEEIAWNAPAFFYTGKMKRFDPKKYKRHIIVFNFFKKDCLRLIFISGARLNDKSGLLEGDYKDGRRIASFCNIDEVRDKEKILRRLIKKWLRTLEK